MLTLIIDQLSFFLFELRDFMMIVTCNLQVKPEQKLETQRAMISVEALLTHLLERKSLIGVYYEHWKSFVSSGKDFKSQWQQYIKDARKVKRIRYTGYLIINLGFCARCEV